MAPNGVWLSDLNEENEIAIDNARIESNGIKGAAGDTFQFERHGYFVEDIVESKPDRPVFNMTVLSRESLQLSLNEVKICCNFNS